MAHVHKWEVWPVRYPKNQQSHHAIARCECGARMDDTQIERILNALNADRSAESERVEVSGENRTLLANLLDLLSFHCGATENETTIETLQRLISDRERVEKLLAMLNVVAGHFRMARIETGLSESESRILAEIDATIASWKESGR